MHENSYLRDMIGYGANMIDPHWPGKARIAVQIALNCEGGAERAFCTVTLGEVVGYHFR